MKTIIIQHGIYIDTYTEYKIKKQQLLVKMEVMVKMEEMEVAVGQLIVFF